MGKTRDQVAELLATGLSQAEVGRQLGISKSLVGYHKRRLGYSVDERYNRRHDWAEVQAYYDQGHSVRECRARFGFATDTWNKAVARGDVVPRSHGQPIETYLVAGRRTNRAHLKGRLLDEGLKDDRCEGCGLDQWNGRPLSLCLHHVNGDGDDNRLENLQLLCPNCHAQTPNFSGKNRGRRQLPAGAVWARNVRTWRLPVVRAGAVCSLRRQVVKSGGDDGSVLD